MAELLTNPEITNTFGWSGTTVWESAYGGFWAFNSGSQGNRAWEYVQQTFSQQEGTTSTLSLGIGVNGNASEYSEFTYLVQIRDASNTVLASTTGSVVSTSGHTAWSPRNVTLNFTSPSDSEGPFTLFVQHIEPTYGETQSHDMALTYARLNGTPADGVICFAAGTHILTPDGPRRAGSLQPGDIVVTHPGGTATLRWAARRNLGPSVLARAPRLRPVRIRAGALGPDLPRRDLLVSRQHRIMLQSRIARRMFGTDEVLLPANRLVGLPGIDIDRRIGQIAYCHFACDTHEVVLAEGLPCETLLPGAAALAFVTPGARAELHAVFPHLGMPEHDTPPARYVPSGRSLTRWLARHRHNARHFFEDWGTGEGLAALQQDALCHQPDRLA